MLLLLDVVVVIKVVAVDSVVAVVVTAGTDHHCLVTTVTAPVLPQLLLFPFDLLALLEAVSPSPFCSLLL